MALPPLPLEERVERAAQLVVRARVFFDIWAYFEGDTRAGLLDTMNEFSEFFRLAPHAHFVAYCVTMAALYDKRRDTITLTSLPRELAKKGILTTVVEAEVQVLLAGALPTANKVGILRHNVFAHRSASLSYDDVFKLAAITAAQMRELTELSLQIANILLRSCGRPEQYINDLPLHDAKAIMMALRGATNN